MATTLRPGSPEEVGMSGPRVQHIAELADQWVREGVAQTMVVLATRRGRIVLHRAYGHLTPDADSPPTPPDALFEVFSITKPFTATALMVLVEEGRVGLNRPVSGYIPEFQGEGKKEVLVRHLLTHTSGINQEELDKYAKENPGKIDNPPGDPGMHPLINQRLALLYAGPLWKPPGVEGSYAGGNYHLITEIVRRVSGMPLDRYAETRIFRPLGMNDTYFCRFDAPRERLVRRAPVPGMYPDELDLAADKERLFWGNSSLVTTAKDLAVFGQMFLNGGAYGEARVLSPASVEAMTRNQIPGIGATFLGEVLPEASWGLGWSVHGSKVGSCGGLYSPASFEHWGWGGNYVWVDPEREIVGVYLSAAPWVDDPFVRRTRYVRHDLFTDAVTASVTEI